MLFNVVAHNPVADWISVLVNDGGVRSVPVKKLDDIEKVAGP